MKTPPELEDAAKSRRNIWITSRDYDDEQIIAVDFGPLADEPSLDVVGETAIVVLEDGQFEFEIPSDAGDVTINKGILTIRD